MRIHQFDRYLHHEDMCSRKTCAAVLAQVAQLQDMSDPSKRSAQSAAEPDDDACSMVVDEVEEEATRRSRAVAPRHHYCDFCGWHHVGSYNWHWTADWQWACEWCWDKLQQELAEQTRLAVQTPVPDDDDMDLAE